MKFRIHLDYGDYQDHIDIEGSSIEEVREQADKCIEQRKPEHYWSEKLEGDL
ncbi:hypothetical protein [Shouchella patagoniensis]|uniref:hypothetical protein n=1 Tax=Shouchella patagoniensis TaxID=228576 RepID=UPI0014754EF1|nr:hypothetical protein [Shouchella patagoniensis]